MRTLISQAMRGRRKRRRKQVRPTQGREGIKEQEEPRQQLSDRTRRKKDQE